MKYSRAAGAEYGQEWSPSDIEKAIREIGRTPRMRTTLYQDATSERVQAAFRAEELEQLDNSMAGKMQRSKRLDNLAQSI